MKLELGNVIINLTSNINAYWIKPIWKTTLMSVNGGWIAKKHDIDPDGDTIYLWAFQTFGEPSNFWPIENYRWYWIDDKYYFSDEADRTLFMLRWG
jgi:hypothetical protein